MEFNEMSKESQDVAKDMIAHCINNGLRMGMGYGYVMHPIHHDIEIKEAFREELEMYVDHTPSDQDNADIEKLEKLGELPQCPTCKTPLTRDLPVNSNDTDVLYCRNGCHIESYSERYPVEE